MIKVTADSAVGCFHYAGGATPCLLLQEVQFTLVVAESGAEWIELEKGADGKRLARLTLGYKACKTEVLVADPQTADSKPIKWLSEATGTVILEELAQAGSFRVVTGTLDVVLDESGPSASLKTLWPVATWPREWILRFTPLGLALRGELAVDGKSRPETLLLPTLSSVARDIAWGNVNQHVRWSGFGDEPANEAEVFKSQIADATPDRNPFPADSNTAWAALRWRVLVDGDTSSFVDDAFESFDARLPPRLVRRQGSNGAQLSDPSLPVAALAVPRGPRLIADLWVALEFHFTYACHRGAILRLLEGDVKATFDWQQSLRRSDFPAPIAQVGFVPQPRKEHFWVASLQRNWVALKTHEATAADLKHDTFIDWSLSKPVNFTLSVVPCELESVAARPDGSAPAAAPVRWLALQQGWLDLKGLVPESGRVSSVQAQRLMETAGGANAVVHGALPLEELGAPAGLLALFGERSAAPGASAARLMLSKTSSVLELWGPIFLWRTPAWWVQDDRAAWVSGDRGSGEEARLKPSPQVLPDLAPAFEEFMPEPEASAQVCAEQLAGALAGRFASTRWIGHRSLDKSSPRTWTLSKAKDADVARLIIPPGIAQSAVAWVEIGESTLLSTLPHDVSLSTRLLDGTRALTKLVCASGGGLALTLTPQRLPALEKPPFPSPEVAPIDWNVSAAEMFNPYIPGLSYDPASQAFGYSHGPLVLMDGYARMGADGTLGKKLGSTLLDAMRPRDDKAMWTREDVRQSSFKLKQGKAVEELELAGWLPRGTLEVKALNVSYTRFKEGMTFSVPSGTGTPSSLKVDISLNSNGFAAPVSVASDGSTYWLEQADGIGNFRNFGQSLLRRDNILIDGRGTRWQFAADGFRIYEQAAADPRVSALTRVQRVTTTASAAVSLGLGADQVLGVSVHEVEAGEGVPASPTWSLHGPCVDGGDPAPPKIGPFTLHPVRLAQVKVGTCRVDCRIGIPFQFPERRETAGGMLSLEWRQDLAGVWQVQSLADGAFDWELNAPLRFNDGKSHIRLERLSGSVSVDPEGALKLAVTSVALSGPMGVLSFNVISSPLQIETDEDGVIGAVSASVRSQPDEDTGFECSCELRFHQSTGEWTVGAEKGEQSPILRWKSECGTVRLEFDETKKPAAKLDQLKLHAATASVMDVPLDLRQTARDQWSFVHGVDNNGASAAQAVAGTITVVDGGTPRLQWSLRASLPLIASELFGRCNTASSYVRADLRVRCSGRLTWANLELPGAVITGSVLVENDYSLVLSDGRVVAHSVLLVFDCLPLDDKGGLPKQFNAAARHQLNGKGVRTTFSAVHRFAAKKGPSGAQVLSLSCWLFLAPVVKGGPAVGPLVPQIRLRGDPTIALARVDAPSGAISGNVARLAFRNAGTPTRINLPPLVSAPTLKWFPRYESERGSQAFDGDPDIWHERGAGASGLSAAALRRMATLQRAALFASGKPAPADGEVVPEWAAILAEDVLLVSGYLAGAADQGVALTDLAVDVFADAVVAREDGNPASSAARCNLLVFADTPNAPPLVSRADALITGRPAALQAAALSWATEEVKRQSARSAFAVVQQGRPASIQAASRLFEAAATDPATGAAKPLQQPAAWPALSDLADTSPKASNRWRGYMSAPPNQGFGIEVLACEPVLTASESGRRARLAVSRLLAGGVSLSEAHAGLSMRQSVKFAGQGDLKTPRSKWPIIRVYGKPKIAGSASIQAPIIDVVEWSVRPGDTVQSSYLLSRSHLRAGQSVEFDLRSARGSHEVQGSNLTELPSVDVGWDGVRWTFHRVASVSTCAQPAQSGACLSHLLSVVTPRDALHMTPEQFAPTQPDPAGSVRLTLGYTELPHAVRSDGKLVTPRRYDEPLLVGLFRTGNTPFSILEIAIVKGRIASVDAGKIGEVQQLQPGWHRSVDCVILRQLSKASVPPNTDVLLNDSYSRAECLGLQHLLKITDIEVGVAVPWLYLAEPGTGAYLALVGCQSPQDKRTVLASVPVTWLDVSVSEQPERLLVVSDNGVCGYGDFAGKTSLRLEAEGFRLRCMSTAMDRRQASRAEAWRFGRSGACTGWVKLS